MAVFKNIEELREALGSRFVEFSYYEEDGTIVTTIGCASDAIVCEKLGRKCRFHHEREDCGHWKFWDLNEKRERWFYLSNAITEEAPIGARCCCRFGHGIPTIDLGDFH